MTADWLDGAGNAVVLVNEHNFTLNRLIRQAERSKDHLITGIAPVGGGAVEADNATARLGGNCVGLQPLPVSNVPNVYHLALDDAGCIHEVGIDSNAANVVDIAAGYGSSVYFALADAY